MLKCNAEEQEFAHEFRTAGISESGKRVKGRNTKREARADLPWIARLSYLSFVLATTAVTTARVASAAGATASAARTTTTATRTTATATGATTAAVGADSATTVEATTSATVEATAAGATVGATVEAATAGATVDTAATVKAPAATVIATTSAVEAAIACVSSSRSITAPWAARTTPSAVDHGPAMGEVSATVIEDGVVMPSHSPMAPSPTHTREGADADPEAKTERHSAPENSRGRGPVEARINREWRAVNRPGVIGRDVDHRRVGWRNHNLASIVVYCLLRRAAQVTRGLRLLAHCLH